MTDQPRPSSEPLRVDTARLKPAIDKLHDLSSRLKQAGLTLDLDSQSYGEPWGDDETGKQFHEKYVGPHSQLIDAVLHTSTGMGGAAEDVSSLVKAFEDVGAAAGQQGQQLRSSMNSGGEQDPPPAPNP
ncbi:hypothetical protein [Streptomyces tubercidicus]|uniref:hypothetical protein n=1 Tax=Streptomyces tubercidicus TaxID=47759 RepID=UPI0036CD2D56